MSSAIYAYYLWGMALNVVIDESFDERQNWKATREKSREVNNTKACVIHDKNLFSKSQRVLD
jgi:hypothetical protein